MMNNLKKAVFCSTPESSGIRRSSAGCCETNLPENALLTSIFEKITCSPITGEGRNIPRIRVDSCDTQETVCDALLNSGIACPSLPLHRRSLNDTKSERMVNKFCSNLRRASCEPNLQLWRSGSSDLPNYRSFEKRKSIADTRRNSPDIESCGIVSDFLVNNKLCLSENPATLLEKSVFSTTERRKSLEINRFSSRKTRDYASSPVLKSPPERYAAVQTESSPYRCPSFLQPPSLSPCFEDRQKGENFSFRAKDENYIQTPFAECSSTPFCTTFSRRISLQLDSFTKSPLFPHSGVFWNEKSNILGTSANRRSRSIPAGSDRRGFSPQIPTTDELNKLLLKFENPSTKKVGSVIGKGGCATVMSGTWKGKPAAVKVLKKKKMISTLCHEWKILKLKPHSTLVQTYSILGIGSQGIISIDANLQDEGMTPALPIHNVESITGLNRDRLGLDLPSKDLDSCQNEDPPNSALIISELCLSSNLLTVINTLGDNLPLKTKIGFLWQLADALVYLHKHGLVHLDVKPQNVFLNTEWSIKLGDFGCCSDMHDKSEVLGTAAYQAPEILRGGIVSDKSDVYSLGVTAWHLLTSQIPYLGFHPHVIIYKVTRLGHRPSLDKDRNSNSDKSSLLENLIMKFIKECWMEEPDQRPSALTAKRYLYSLNSAPTGAR